MLVLSRRALPPPFPHSFAAAQPPSPRRMSDANGSDNVTPLFDEPPRRRPRVRKLRLLVVLVPLALLAILSTVFGMMMAVASDLPALENRKEYQDARNSVLYDNTGKTSL